jgi:integrase
MALTQRQVKNARYRGDGMSADYRYDGTVPGFGLRVYPSGRKAFILHYRNASRRPRLLTLGPAGALTLEQARKRARRAFVAILDGADPVAERRKPAGMTLAAFAPLYIERHAKPRKKSWKDDERRLENDVLPALGKRALADIRRPDVAQLHAKVGKRAKTEANRQLALLGVLFSCAAEWGHLPEGHPNPAVGVKPFPEKSRERYVLPVELPRLVAAITDEPNPYIRAAIWLSLLTGCRKTELLTAKWADIDGDRAELRLPDTKAGRSHVIPLSGAAQDVLKQVPRQLGNPYIFAGARPGERLRYIDRPWRAIRKRAGLEDVHLHDLRRTVGSWLAADGASLPLIGKVLNHSNPSTTAIYARLGEDKARAALEDYGAKVLSIAGGSAHK